MRDRVHQFGPVGLIILVLAIGLAAVVVAVTPADQPGQRVDTPAITPR